MSVQTEQQQSHGTLVLDIPDPAPVAGTVNAEVYGRDLSQRIHFYEGMLEALEVVEEEVSGGGTGCEAYELAEALIDFVQGQRDEVAALRRRLVARTPSSHRGALVADVGGATVLIPIRPVDHADKS